MMHKVGLRLLVVLGISLGILGIRAAAQGPIAAPPAGPPVNQSDDPLLKAFRWRSIGPASMGGRVDDIAVVESNPFIIYVGFATGGVWKTTNNGTTWTPIFDTSATSSIGDIAVSQSNPNIVWVGTGEPNNRQSSSWGDGVYKSADAGKTFTNMGLNETHSIARIVIDPKNPDIVYVAAVGHLFGPNKERGVFKTIDSGKTWTQAKFIDEDTGFTDLVMDPSDPKTLYAASYQRRRTPWGFNGGGPGSGIWKTTDAGKTWTKRAGNGLPGGLLGRIGLDVSRSKPNVVYAQIEVGASPGTGGNVSATGGPAEPGAGGFGGMGGEAQAGGRGAQAGRPGQPAAGQPLAAQPPAGQAPAAAQPPAAPPDPTKSGVWRSDDKGKTWRLMSNNNNRPMYYSQIRVDPTNDQIVYTGGAPFHKSTDGGKTFKVVEGIAHSDHHAAWINPKNGNHVIIGNDGGIDISYDQAETWEFVNTLPVGQFYAISADMRKPYYVCGGLQDNGSWCGPSAVRNPVGILNSDWFRVGGGDGFYTQQDPTDYTIVYAESQDGNINRLDLRTGRTTSIKPRAAARPRQAPAGAAVESPDETMAMMAQQMGFGVPRNANIVPRPPDGEQYRFFWNTPVVLSPHNPRTLYVGANKLFISRDRGETWTATPDLTRNVDRFKLPIMGMAGDKPMASKHDGAGAYSNIITIAESPVMPGVLWVGTNDGNLQVSRDGGATWKNVADKVPGIPKDYLHVSRVEASHVDAGTCYASFDAHRTDDFKPYVFVTRDYGETWTSIAGNLPTGNVNVVREDPKNRNLLYLGTEFALYVSLNGGKEWKRFMTGLPTVRIDDLLVHPRDSDLIVGTHGRSIYIIDDITPLEQLDDKVLAEDVHVFDVRPGTAWLQEVTRSQVVGGSKLFRGENPQPGTVISYYLKSVASGDVKITIADITGKVVRNLTGTKEAGLNRVQWDLRGDPPPRPANLPPQAAGRMRNLQGPPAEPGVYLAKLSIGGKDYTTKIVVEADTLEQ